MSALYTFVWHMGKRRFIFLLCLLFSLSSPVPACPQVCTCSVRSGKKTVTCTEGGLLSIPVSEMDTSTHILVVDPPHQAPNNLTVGRIFLKFNNIEEIRIRGSSVPAIGDRSFWPGRRLKILDLSRNAISFLLESDFMGLKNLQELDLSDNNIFATPSAPFMHLLSLKKLNLARNKLQTLVPRFFYQLSNLEELDLSGNSLENIDPENLQDVKKLKILNLSRCRLTSLHPIIYQQLPVLEILDLSDNLIASLAPAEFRHLANLVILYLDGNLLTGLTEGTFLGQKLRILGLSRNNLSSLSDRTFVNSSIRQLDLSHNRLEYILRDSFEPLSDSLEVLNVSFNDLGNQALAFLVSSLKSLKDLRATNLLITNVFPNTFVHNSRIRSLNLSRNSLKQLETASIMPLENLETLDLTFNLLPSVPKPFFLALLNITSFRSLLLFGNPFDCESCGLRPLLQHLNESHFLEQNCSGSKCLRCHSPPQMSGRYVHSVSSEELYCLRASYDRQYLAYTSQVGLIVAVSIIVVILCIIIIIIIVYRRHIAHYYTHEEERRAWKTMYENPALAPSGGVHYSDEKPTFISTPDKVDENIDDLRTPANILR